MSDQNRPPRSARNVRRAGTRPTLGGYGMPGQQRSNARSSRRNKNNETSALGSFLGSFKMPHFALPTSSWRVAAGLIAVILLGFGLLNMTAVKSVKVEGAKALNPEVVTQATQDALSKQWFGGVLPMVNTAAIAEELPKIEPGIKEAKVSRSLPGTLVISIVERTPSLNWKSGGQRFVLDADGTVIGPTPAEYDSLPTVVDNTNLPVKAGERVVPAAFITFTTDILARLAAAKIVVASLSVPQTTTELYAKTDKGYTLKFDTSRPAEAGYKDLDAVLKQLAALKKTPVEYIDLRVPNKAYYR